MSEEQVPYKLTLGNDVQPIDAAWLNMTKIPVDRVQDLTGNEFKSSAKVGYPVPSWISLQHTALGEKESDVLNDVHQEDLLPYKAFLERVSRDSIRAGISEEDTEHLVHVLALGILVGVKAVEITTDYAARGIKDIEAGEA